MLWLLREKRKKFVRVDITSRSAAQVFFQIILSIICVLVRSQSLSLDKRLAIHSMSPRRLYDFSNEVAIVTGAGSRPKGEVGNGGAAAASITRHGGCVAIVDHDLNPATKQNA